MFLKEKIDGKTKGINFTDGRKQRKFINKEEGVSPTAILESVLIKYVIDEHEEIYVVKVNIPNYFIQTKIDNE